MPKFMEWYGAMGLMVTLVCCTLSFTSTQNWTVKLVEITLKH
jgi:uncharacterized YccA/Bax inhibitor family protein